MLEQVVATRLIRKMTNGRTSPAMIECEDDNGNVIELVVKTSKGTMQGTLNLAIESIAAMLASDLGLPVPAPYIVELTPQFTEFIPDPVLRSLFSESCNLAFGSALVNQGYSAWPNGAIVNEKSCLEAAEIFTFDAIIANSDRRPENPNCLVKDNKFVIIDHELTLCQSQILFWQEPWAENGFEDISQAGRHIFNKMKLAKSPANMNRFVLAWESLPNERFDEYISAIPREWATDRDRLMEIRDYLRTVKSNISQIVNNALRALS